MHLLPRKCIKVEINLGSETGAVCAVWCAVCSESTEMAALVPPIDFEKHVNIYT